ncbi:hypothetical protein [Treponema primitia]|uniref:hypothetical protein n=1 Tax=Treponema primitia TaxID=88058 RepID=UPI000255562F|nr:hypothetical protein [Treponema primitia]
MILIGATGRNRGKTVLAEELIRLFKDRFPVVGLKVTTTAYAGAPCHHGDMGCGICSNLSSYVLQEERGLNPNSPECMGKDTTRLLRAGAERVYWLRSIKNSLAEGFSEFLKQIPPSVLVIGESNSLREVVQPGCFIMVSAGAGEQVKPSAARVAELAQFTLESPITAGLLQKLMAEITVVSADGQVRVRLAG